MNRTIRLAAAAAERLAVTGVRVGWHPSGRPALARARRDAQTAGPLLGGQGGPLRWWPRQPAWSQCSMNVQSLVANRPGSTRWTKCPSPAHSSICASGRRPSRSRSPPVARRRNTVRHGIWIRAAVSSTHACSSAGRRPACPSPRGRRRDRRPGQSRLPWRTTRNGFRQWMAYSSRRRKSAGNNPYGQVGHGAGPNCSLTGPL